MKKIIPAMDLLDGNVVRLYKGDFDRIDNYSRRPVDLLKHFFNEGIDQIHVINLNGAKSGEFENGPNYEVIRSLIQESNKWGSKIQLGGGIRTERTIRNLLDLGLYKVIIGTIAIQNQILFKNLLKKYKDEIIVALDVLNGNLRIKGWLEDTDINLESHFKSLEEQGVSNFIITDVSRDGTLEGPNFQIYKKISNIKHPETRIIASGGISNLNDISKVLNYADGVIIGKAYYSNKLSNKNLRDLTKKYDPTNLAKRIVPCLDIKNGRVVKGVQYINLQDSGDPVELSRFYNSEGADELVFLDISATLEKRSILFQTLRRVSEEVYIPFTAGGGIRNLNDITNIINIGAEKVSINTAAVDNPKVITEGAQKFGSQSIVCAIDVKKKGDAWEVYIKAGTESTGLDAIEWAKEVIERGAGELIVTSIDRDGTQIGYDLKLIQNLTKVISVPLIASGGAGKYEHFYQAIKVGAEAVLAASLFHTKTIKIKDLKSYLYKRDIKIRF